MEMFIFDALESAPIYLIGWFEFGSLFLSLSTDTIQLETKAIKNQLFEERHFFAIESTRQQMIFM